MPKAADDKLLVRAAKAFEAEMDGWFTRYNNMNPPGRMHEVVHSTDRDCISDDTVFVISRHATRDLAEKKMRKLSRAAAMRAALKVIHG